MKLGWVAILTMAMLLDYCVFERKMGVKTAKKLHEIAQICALFTGNWYKSTLSEQVLYHRLWIGFDEYKVVVRIARLHRQALLEIERARIAKRGMVRLVMSIVIGPHVFS